jgi:hypothetical protein
MFDGFSGFERGVGYQGREARGSNRREVYHVDVRGRGDSITFWDQGIRIDVTDLPSRGSGRGRKTDVVYNLMEHGRSYFGNRMVCKKGGTTLYTDKGIIKIRNLGNQRHGRRAFLEIEVPKGVRYVLKRAEKSKKNNWGSGRLKVKSVVQRVGGGNGNARLVDDFGVGIELPDFIEK